MKTTNHSQKIMGSAIDRGYVSVMNDTKWHELCHAITSELPFAPAYQRKDITATEPDPQSFEKDVHYFGDWTEGIRPFYSIEWIRIRPRYLKHRGQLIEPEIIDEEPQLLSLLQRLKTPFQKHGDSIFIFGFTKPGQMSFENKTTTE